MSELRSLLEEGATPLEVEILRTAKARVPSERALAQTLSALGVAGATATAAATLAATPARALFTLFAKWFGVGVIAALATMAAADRLVPSEPARPAPVPPPVTEPAAAAAALPSSEPVAAPESSVAAGPTRRHEAPPRERASNEPAAPESDKAPSEPAARRGASELALVDSARAALTRHDDREALRLLDQHRAAFARGQLAEEAAYLRVKALFDQGDRPGANRAAAELAAKYPTSPYLSRVRALLSHD